MSLCEECGRSVPSLGDPDTMAEWLSNLRRLRLNRMFTRYVNKMRPEFAFKVKRCLSRRASRLALNGWEEDSQAARDAWVLLVGGTVSP